MQRTYKTRLDNLFCQMSQGAKTARAEAIRKAKEERDRQGDQDSGDQQVSSVEDGYKGYEPFRSGKHKEVDNEKNPKYLYKTDDYDPFEDLVSADQWTAAQENVRRRANEAESWLPPEHAVAVFCFTIADSGAVLRRPCTDRQLAMKLRKQTEDETWDLELATEARELVAAWTQAFLIERCGYDTPVEQ